MLSKIALLATLANAAIHTVDVGETGNTFSPQTIDASEGDTIIFHLYPTHDVVQGAFDSPCTPSDGGFYSGPFSDTDNGAKKFVVNVTSNDPIYYYCSVQRHCQVGMVGGVNVPSDGDTIDAYGDAARDVQQSSTPDEISGGELLEDEQLNSLTSSQGGSTVAPSATGASSEAPSATDATTTGGDPSATATPTESAQSTGAANVRMVGEASGVLAAALGFAAWLL